MRKEVEAYRQGDLGDLPGAPLRPHKARITGMRQGEILDLTWGQVDVKEGFIQLAPEHCQSNDGRLVPLTRELVEMFKAMTRGLPAVKVFTFAGWQIGAIKKVSPRPARGRG